MSVSIAPGWIEFTRMLYLLSVVVALLVMPRIAHLLAAYAIVGRPRNPAIDEMFTMLPDS